MHTTEPRRKDYWVKLSIVLFAIASFLAFAPQHLTAGEPVAQRYASNQIDVNDPSRVDVALVLAVDVSSSIKSSERLFQREAYAAALSDPRVAQMALGGGAGRVAIAYMEWSGSRYQRVHLPMRVMSTPQQLAQFAHDILSIADHAADPMYVQPTAVGNALLAAEQAMAQLPVRARDYVIDISGDGVINDGTGISSVRERLIAMGLTVNGLPIEVSQRLPSYDGIPEEDVTRFYADCVIGGPGAFHVVARGFDDVRETLIMKLMLEMAQMEAEDRRRIAMAWNGGQMQARARIVPATILQLDTQPSQQRERTDCGDKDRRAENPFQSN